jgi:AcrR family transcriptional regulator
LQAFNVQMNDSTPKERKPRADALRNRERILDEAKTAFTRAGGDISLEDVARQAGVGVGTLYRHFPTREALLEGVYRAEVAKLAEEERRLSALLPPLDALRSWMLLFIDYIATKKIIAPALNSIVGGPTKLFESSGAQIKDAIRSLVTRAIASGDGLAAKCKAAGRYTFARVQAARVVSVALFQSLGRRRRRQRHPKRKRYFH